MTRSEELAGRAIGLCLQRRVAFAGAVSMRARGVFDLCHGATPTALFDQALERLWDDLRCGDMADVDAIYAGLARAPEAYCNDTLAREWIAWLALATFELVSKLPTARLPVQAIAQCSALGLTIAAELDHRIGWDGPAGSGTLATAEWVAQQRCLAILLEDPENAAIPLETLAAAGAEEASILAACAPQLAAATGWDLVLE